MIFFQILKVCFLFLLGFFLLLCFTPIGVHLTSTTEGYRIRFKLGFFSFSILSPSEERTAKKKKSKVKKESKTSPKKKSVSKKTSDTKEKKPKQKKKSPNKEKKPKSSSEEGSTLENIFTMIQTFLPLLLASFQVLGSHKRIKKCKLELVVGSSDPVEAVALYGQAHALLGTLWIPLDHALNLEEGSARVLLEFEETRPALYGEFLLTITIGQLLAVLGKLGFGSWKIYQTNRTKSHQ